KKKGTTHPVGSHRPNLRHSGFRFLHQAPSPVAPGKGRGPPLQAAARMGQEPSALQGPVDEVVEVRGLAAAGDVPAVHADEGAGEEAPAPHVVVGELVGGEVDGDLLPALAVEGVAEAVGVGTHRHPHVDVLDTFRYGNLPALEG